MRNETELQQFNNSKVINKPTSETKTSKIMELINSMILKIVGINDNSIKELNEITILKGELYIKIRSIGPLENINLVPNFYRKLFFAFHEQNIVTLGILNANETHLNFKGNRLIEGLTLMGFKKVFYKCLKYYSINTERSEKLIKQTLDHRIGELAGIILNPKTPNSKINDLVLAYKELLYQRTYYYKLLSLKEDIEFN